MPSSARKPGQLTAMISSTALDLPEHRVAVMEACLAAGVFPIGMEALPARDATGIAVSLEMVDHADIYLGLYAWRYGWLPDGKSISITEMEFDRAVERKAAGALSEILIFTAHKKHPCTVEDVEADKEAQRKLTAFKTKASSGRVRKEFTSVEELRRLVGEALAEFKSRQTADSGTKASSQEKLSTSIPHNLPTLQPFFGREEELKKIAAALDPRHRGWGTLIDGDGGRGKTSLAVYAAYHVPPAHFERIVFVSVKKQQQDDHRLRDLGSFALGSWQAMLGEIARRLDMRVVTEASEDRRARLLSENLNDRRILLLLDNLETLTETEQDELFAFLDYMPAGNKALLTSRTFVGNRVHALDLPVLDTNTALQMLAEIAAHNEAFASSTESERRDLIHQTQGNALLLRWVAGQVGHGSCTNIADALAHLRACPNRNDALGFVFGDIVASLSVKDVSILATLSYVPQPIRLQDIAGITGVNGKELVSRLKHLRNRSLIVPSEEFQTFALMPMVADFLRKAKPEAVAEAGDLLEKRAYVLIVENGGKKHDRFPVLDAAWPIIFPVLPRFLEGPNVRLQTVCTGLNKFLNFTGRWNERLALCTQAEAKAVVAGDYAKAGWRAYHAGWVHRLRKQAAAVLACANRATLHWDQAFPPGKGTTIGLRERAIALQLRGIGHELNKDYKDAIAAYQDVVKLFCSLSAESVDVATALNDLAMAKRHSGDFNAAEQDFREALRIGRAVANPECVATFTGNLAELALDQEYWWPAEVLAREALPLSEKVGRQGLIAAVCWHLAKALARQSKGAEGLLYAQRAVDIYQKLGSPDLVGAQATLWECEAGAQKVS